ncbi:MAG TPA: RNA polymerase sigma factor [Candidatus Limnocylindrales bacterium]|nr:RNA polymerase sigma factor [Candidatus Limnocylindrales bacterium]
MDSDTSLAARLARDLDGAFPDLVEAHVDHLFTIALRLLGDRRDAEEVAQDALVAAHRAIAGYESERIVDLRLRPWLASITVNLARNKRRRFADRHPAQSLEPLTASGFDPRDDAVVDPSTVAVERESAGELGSLLLQLPVSLRTPIVLRHVAGLSVAETAAALGRPEGTIKAQVSRGLDRLRDLLERPRSPRGAGDAHLRPADPPDTPRGVAFAATEVLR